MNIFETSVLHDNRTNCYSILTEMYLFDYLEMVKTIYDNKGGIEAQREPLKSSSALRIRKQMVKDIIIGTVLPPIVIGIINKKNGIKIQGTKELKKLIESVHSNNMSIIDGMQRTTALFKALETGANQQRKIRVEFWIAEELNSLIYRMLVLNTGQVPWNIRRQIETVFTSMIDEIKMRVPNMEIYTINDSKRRSQAGQFHGKDIIELYLAFGARKEKVDTKERLADEFTKLDFIDATVTNEFSEIFYLVLGKLASLDIVFGKYTTLKKDRFSNGTDLFRSQPARVGFITAIAKKIFGRPGVSKESEKIDKASKSILEEIEKVIIKINHFSNNQLEEYLAFPVLNEKLDTKSSRVGDFEREFFTKSFETFVEDGDDLNSLSICWMSY